MSLKGNTVFILGAGASQESGAPLMSDFLDVAEALLRENKVPEAAADFQCVFDALAELRLAQAKSDIELDNLEAALNAFEFAKLLESDEAKRVEWGVRCTSLSKLIATTLESTVRFRYASENGYQTSDSYTKFAALIKNPGGMMRPTILTFNYDLALDWALHHSRQDVDYCLEPTAVNRAAIGFLKLHGSLNFAQCPSCKKLTHMGCAQVNKNRAFIGLNEVYRLRMSKELTRISCCPNVQFEESPFIVPPSLAKDQYRDLMGTAWRRASLALSEAENIIVCGFSLPSTDAFFKYLFANAMRSATRIKVFRVYDPSEQVGQRFAALLGQSLRSRFSFVPHKFGKAVNDLLNAQRMSSPN